MTEDTSLTTTAAPDEPTTEPETTDDHPGKEAARYRTRLRAAEGERDGLNERVTSLAGQLANLQRAEVERLAAAQLSRASDVWLDGIEVSELVDDDGRVDPARVVEAVTAVLDGRPQLAVPVTRLQPDHSQGHAGSDSDSRVSMADLLRNARTR